MWLFKQNMKRPREPASDGEPAPDGERACPAMSGPSLAGEPGDAAADAVRNPPHNVPSNYNEHEPRGPGPGHPPLPDNLLPRMPRAPRFRTMLYEPDIENTFPIEGCEVFKKFYS